MSERICRRCKRPAIENSPYCDYHTRKSFTSIKGIAKSITALGGLAGGLAIFGLGFLRRKK